ncbi:ricin-type beta-trefoil lectin domain protein [Actinoallomurus purpureus]|uniref:RICIN domain-containing protein n=1 Tax=Actinoallomurus purpureus TaxID=478114 RepID=UPI0020920238|nr:ricin-type beta-trefoil lectin domain protein [Actinoallomurus purpureus]MCO6010480.1 ricin-type beta-trefoil lectin domain protein [Actinoallomurus purpureus]
MKRTIIGTVALGLTGLVLSGTPAQAASSYVSYKNSATHKCLSVNGKRQAYVARCTNGRAQKWTRLAFPGGHAIRNQATGYCLTMVDSRAKTRAVVVRPCEHFTYQYWAPNASHGQQIMNEWGPGGYLRATAKGAVYVGGSSTVAQRSWTLR